jgi:hypothetical protein
MDDILPPDMNLTDAIEPTLEVAANAAQNLLGEISMVAVNSSDIAAWGYAPLKAQLQIQFTNGRMYLYENISPLEFEQLALAPSKGQAFWQLIRRNPIGHPFTRLQ